MSTEFPQNHGGRRLLLSSFCLLMLLPGWWGAAGADPLRRIDQIKAAMAAPTAADASTSAGQAPARSGLLHRPPSRAFPPGTPLAMPSWSTAFVRDGISYPLTVMGTDPALGQTTTIPTVIFAYRLQLADGSVFDASSDVIEGVTPVQGVLASPIFTPAPWTIGGKSLGITQWSDAVMRANFWGRMSAGYHVLLGTPAVIPITVDVPAAYGFSFPAPESGGLLAVIDSNWLLDLNVQVTNAYGVPSTTLPIHLFSQVQGTVYGGYHDVILSTTASGATIAAPFIEAGYYSKALQIAYGNPNGENTGGLAHEIAEWLMDPALSNATAPWQDPAEPGVCDSALLEVGDPLESIAPGMDVGGYRFPDVALLPWFTGSQVLQSVNHQYSLFGTLTSASSVCPDYANFAQFYYYTPGADTTVFTGINNQHQVAGYFTVGNVLSSFIASNVDPVAGTATTTSSVYFPGSVMTVAIGLNDAGNVVGFYLDGHQQEHGFLLNGTVYTSIDFPGAVATEALGINKHGDIVGDYTDTAGTVHGFVRMNGGFRSVDAPFASGGLSIRAINDSRIVAGTYSSGGTIASFSGSLGNLQPFSYPQVSPLDPEYPATFTTYAYGINNSQEIAGAFSYGAYVANAGLFEPLAQNFFAGAQASGLFGVNDSGVAAGAFADSAGTYGLLAVPGKTAFGLPFQRIMIAPP